jgi:ComF family protein
VKFDSKRLGHAVAHGARVVVEDVAAALFPGACRACGASLPAPPASGPPWSRALHDGTLRRVVLGPLSLPLWFLCVSCAATLERSRGGRSLADPGVPCVAAFEPSPALFDLVHALKYEAFQELAPWLGRRLAIAARATLGRNLVLVPVPLHASRRRERGFNQSVLLARAAARHLGCPVTEDLLERRRATRPQARLESAARAANVAGAFVRRAPLPAGGERIVVVDDVVTTGATVRAVLDALGAGRHAVLTLCAAAEALRPAPPEAAAVARTAVLDPAADPLGVRAASSLPRIEGL